MQVIPFYSLQGEVVDEEEVLHRCDDATESVELEESVGEVTEVQEVPQMQETVLNMEKEELKFLGELEPEAEQLDDTYLEENEMDSLLSKVMGMH